MGYGALRRLSRRGISGAISALPVAEEGCGIIFAGVRHRIEPACCPLLDAALADFRLAHFARVAACLGSLKYN